MQIEPIDQHTIKVTLSLADMQAYDLDYEQMDYSDPTTKKALLAIMHKVQQRTLVDIEDHKLFIEAFSQDDGGCVLYINVMHPIDAKRAPRQRSSFDTPLIFGIDSVDGLTVVCRRLSTDYTHLIVNSAIHTTHPRGYVLLLYTYCRSNARLIDSLCEHCVYLGKGAVLAAHYIEHGKEILNDRAIETWLTYLG